MVDRTSFAWKEAARCPYSTLMNFETSVRSDTDRKFPIVSLLRYLFSIFQAKSTFFVMTVSDFHSLIL